MKIEYCKKCSRSELIKNEFGVLIRRCFGGAHMGTPISLINYCPKKGRRPVRIICPNCDSIQDAIEDHTTIPFSTLIHECTSCEFMIMESEWEYAD